MRRDVEGFVIILLFIIMGVVFSGLLYYLYDNGIVINEMITGSITIDKVMALNLVLWSLVGVIVGMSRK